MRIAQCVSCLERKKIRSREMCCACYVSWNRKKNPELLQRNRKRALERYYETRRARQEKSKDSWHKRKGIIKEERNKRRRWKYAIMSNKNLGGLNVRCRCGKLVSTPFKDVLNNKDYTIFVKILSDICV